MKTDKQEKPENLRSNGVTIYLYYNGDYAMKYEGLTRREADELLLKWNSLEYSGWSAEEGVKK